ncbi:hypothetical protein C0991_005375, partial [Blastosporella zonata]
MTHMLNRLENARAPIDWAIDRDLEALLKEIEEYIKRSASLCDLFMKKTTFQKAMKSDIYGVHLARSVKHFMELGDRLQRALSHHIVRSSDTNIGQQEIQLQDVQNIFVHLSSPVDKEIQELIKRGGGPKVIISKDDLLTKLAEKCGDKTIVSGQQKKGLQKLRKTLQDADFNTELDNHFSMFVKKLNYHLKDLPATLENHRDLIISSLAGGYKYIEDQDIQTIWKQMGWRITVKSRNFVLALRDYYVNGASSEPPNSPQQLVPSSVKEEPEHSSPARAIHRKDAWAMEYINLSFFQPIAEAIDDDGSGYISIQEVNEFTKNRMKGTTVPEWLAYWALGWQTSISQYRDKIYRVLRKIHQLRDKVRPDNLMLLDEYMHKSFPRLDLLLASTATYNGWIKPELLALREKFSADEDSRLRTRFEDVGIESPSDVETVTGPGRIERFIYPLIYILLQRHLKVIQLMRTRSLDEDEFVDMIGEFDHIFTVFDGRWENDLM